MKKEYGTIEGIPIVGSYRTKEGAYLPLVQVGNDIQYVEGCIKDREEHPEYYMHEDIPAVIARQKELLAKLKQEAQL